jgi:hypothetical protein
MMTGRDFAMASSSDHRVAFEIREWSGKPGGN